MSQLRQLLLLFASSFHSFNCGLFLAFPSILNPAILSPNTTDIKALPDEASWIASSLGLSGILGFIILSPMFQIVGRKSVNIMLNVFVLIGWIILYFATSVALLIIGRLVQGLAVGGTFIIAITIGEYSHKTRRGYFMAIKKVWSACGSLVCHSLGLLMTWRQITIIGAVTVSLSIILLLPFPESPAFLAMRGRFDESRESFYWLFGTSEESKKELEELIYAQVKIIEQEKIENNRSLHTAKRIFQKDFLRPLFIVIVATIAMDASGRYFLLAYITQIMVEITGNPLISVYCASAADILLIIALLLSCLVVKRFNRRTILLRLGSILVTLMFLVSLTSFLGSKFNVLEMKWITASLILLISFISHVGFVTVVFALNAEIFPLQLKGLGSLMSGIMFSIFFFITIKVTPVLIDKTGIVGTFAVFGSCILFCLFILYFILPETKNKTLQEIENEIRGKKINKSDKIDEIDVELTLLGSN